MLNPFKVSKPSDSSFAEDFTQFALLGSLITGQFGIVMTARRDPEHLLIGIVIWVLAFAIFGIAAFISYRVGNQIRRSLWLYAHLETEKNKRSDVPAELSDGLREMGHELLKACENKSTDELAKETFINPIALEMFFDGMASIEMAVEITHRLTAHLDIPIYPYIQLIYER